MNDHELDMLVAGTATVSDEEIARWVCDVPFDNLCEAIMTTTDFETTPTDVREPENVHHLRPARRWKRVAVLASAAASIAVLLLAVSVRDGDHQSKAWAAPLIEFAQRSPLMLIDDSAWRVTRADESSADDGEMTFASGTLSADLTWHSGPLAEWLGDRKHDGIDHGPHAVANGTAEVVQYNGTQTFTALWSADDRVLEFRIDGTTAGEFGALLDRLVVVDIDTWLGAMPASVISAADQPSVVTEMLAGIPLPSGFDTGALVDQADVKDRYQLGARIVGAVSCAWIQQWIDATDAGDSTSAQSAVAAMTTSSAWPIVQEMGASGAYPEVLQSYVELMIHGEAVAGDKARVIDGYRAALGCEA
jgi:hypothetical protein